MIADLKPYAEYKESGLPWLGQVPGHWEANAEVALFWRERERSTATGDEDKLLLGRSR